MSFYMLFQAITTLSYLYISFACVLGISYASPSIDRMGDFAATSAIADRSVPYSPESGLLANSKIGEAPISVDVTLSRTLLEATRKSPTHTSQDFAQMHSQGEIRPSATNTQSGRISHELRLTNRSDVSVSSPEDSMNDNNLTGMNRAEAVASTNLSQPSDHLDETAEMHTNNHQLSPPLNSHNPSGHNSRHYNTYQPISNSITSSGHLGKYGSHSTSLNAHTPNLNNIHGLPAKSSSGVGSSLSGLLGSNSGGLSLLGSSAYGLALQNVYSSAHYSGQPSGLSPNTLQQLFAQQKQYQQQQQQQHQDQQRLNQQLQDQQQHLQQNNYTMDFSGSAICGRQQVGAREPRIVGGNSTYEGEFPWAVSIQRHGNHHCGGVIVGRRWILTAAHCVRSQLVGNLLVRTGGHTLSRSSNHLSSHLERDYLVDQIVMHDDFSRYDNLTASQMKSSANTNNADIALLRLKSEILWNELVWPVCFPRRESGNFSGHDAIVIGWGKLNEKSEDFSNELQKVKLTIIDNKVCQNWFRQAGREMPIDDRIICAGFKSGGKDACHGDSGGPLLSKVNGHYVVVGVVSTGIGCARPLLPGLYSRVSSYINWIERHVI